MKFGKLPDTELNRVDFSLPDEPAGNRKILGGAAASATAVYVGGPQWSVPGWLGKIYPAKTKDKELLDNYVQHFNGIELNATHYKIYDTATIAKWAEKAGDKRFLFCPKMYQGITHQGSLRGKDKLTKDFIDSIATFGKHLGPVFIQLSDSFGPARKEELFDFLQALPGTVSYFLELRHPDWFSQEAVRKELFNRLYMLTIGTVITDTAGRRDCVHMYLTVPKAFIRFVANSLHPTDHPRLDAWVQRIKTWIEQGLQELYFIIHMPDELYSPELTVYFADQLYAATGIQLAKPVFIEAGTKPTGSQISFFD